MPDSEVKDIFCYGVLMFPQVVRKLTGRDFQMVEAVVENYVRLLAFGRPGVPFTGLAPRQK